MICSAIIPTRKRLPRLLVTLDSLVATANDPSQIEAVLRVDDDDEETKTQFPKDKYPWVKMVIGSRYEGYNSMGKFVTEASREASGKWSLLIDDDSWLVGKGWDSQLSQLPTDGWVAMAEYYHLGGSNYINTQGCPVGLFFPTRFWERFGIQEIPCPADEAMRSLAVDCHKWQVKFLVGITYRHDRREEDHR
jgi:hypothetical protein